MNNVSSLQNFLIHHEHISTAALLVKQNTLKIIAGICHYVRTIDCHTVSFFFFIILFHKNCCDPERTTAMAEKWVGIIKCSQKNIKDKNELVCTDCWAVIVNSR